MILLLLFVPSGIYYQFSKSPVIYEGTVVRKQKIRDGGRRSIDSSLLTATLEEAAPYHDCYAVFRVYKFRWQENPIKVGDTVKLKIEANEPCKESTSLLLGGFVQAELADPPVAQSILMLFLLLFIIATCFSVLFYILWVYFKSAYNWLDDLFQGKFISYLIYTYIYLVFGILILYLIIN